MEDIQSDMRPKYIHSSRMGKCSTKVNWLRASWRVQLFATIKWMIHCTSNQNICNNVSTWLVLLSREWGIGLEMWDAGGAQSTSPTRHAGHGSTPHWIQHTWILSQCLMWAHGYCVVNKARDIHCVGIFHMRQPLFVTSCVPIQLCAQSYCEAT